VRRREIAPDIYERIAELAAKRIAATEIYKDLQLDKRYADRLPSSVRTIQNIVRDLSLPDTSPKWSVGDSSPEEAAAVLPILKSVVTETKGRRRHLTKNEVRWLTKLHPVTEGLLPFERYRVARVYLLREERGEPTEDLDTALAFTPWRDEKHAVAFEQAIEEGWIERPRTVSFIAGILRARGITGIAVVYEEPNRPANDN
jgi:hypothetical protein